MVSIKPATAATVAVLLTLTLRTTWGAEIDLLSKRCVSGGFGTYTKPMRIEWLQVNSSEREFTRPLRTVRIIVILNEIVQWVS